MILLCFLLFLGFIGLIVFCFNIPKDNKNSKSWVILFLTIFVFSGLLWFLFGWGLADRGDITEAEDLLLGNYAVISIYSFIFLLITPLLIKRLNKLKLDINKAYGVVFLILSIGFIFKTPWIMALQFIFSVFFAYLYSYDRQSIIFKSAGCYLIFFIFYLCSYDVQDFIKLIPTYLWLALSLKFAITPLYEALDKWSNTPFQR